MSQYLSQEEILNGQVLLINKELTWTSFDVVNKIRGMIKKNFQLKKVKVGHAGTLDPLATGLVIVCTGKATKQINEYMGQHKEYITEIDFSFSTPSFDLETEKDKEFSTDHVSKENFEKLLKEKFSGEIQQIPPVFSAVKHKGKRAYSYARSGEEIKLNPKTIIIYDIELVQYELPKVILKIKCGKGTYIRSLARDIGKELGVGGTLISLKRTRIGNFITDDAISIEDFKKKLEYL